MEKVFYPQLDILLLGHDIPYPFLVNNTDVKYSIPVGINGIQVGSFGYEHSETFHLGEAGSKGQRILAPVEVPGN